MKLFLIVLLLLIPLVYAQNVLEARKASLDLNANEFILQMNAVINYSSNKSSDLTMVKTNFEAKLTEALQVKTLDELKNKEKEMKGLAKQFKEIAKEKFKEKGMLRVELFKVSQKSKFQDKKNKINKERMKLIDVAYDKRISEINEKIKENNESRVQKILLDKFQKSKSKLNETDFVKTRIRIRGGLIEGTASMIKKTWSFVMSKMKLASEEG
ncbi:MAG: hypothetical protein AABW88_04925 [Nanoarchaeota archaeon]